MPFQALCSNCLTAVCKCTYGSLILLARSQNADTSYKTETHTMIIVLCSGLSSASQIYNQFEQGVPSQHLQFITISERQVLFPPIIQWSNTAGRNPFDQNLS